MLAQRCGRGVRPLAPAAGERGVAEPRLEDRLDEGMDQVVNDSVPIDRGVNLAIFRTFRDKNTPRLGKIRPQREAPGESKNLFPLAQAEGNHIRPPALALAAQAGRVRDALHVAPALSLNRRVHPILNAHNERCWY